MSDQQQQQHHHALLIDKPQPAEAPPQPPPWVDRAFSSLVRILPTAGLGLTSFGCCVLLSLQNSSYTLLRRYSSGVLKEHATSQSILLVGEVLKLCFSLVMCVRDRAGLRPNTLITTSLKMLVPAAIFLAMNLLSFVALRRISASAFTLIQQTKIIFTALLSRLLLERQLSSARWRALLTLFCAVLIICEQTSPHEPTGCELLTAPPKARALEWSTFMVGVAAVGLEAALSGLSNVYFEKVLTSTPLSVWERNVQLAAWSMCIYGPLALYEHPQHVFYGWSSLTFLVACLGALGGILIGLVLKFCDSIVKNLALSTAIITTALLDHVYFAGPMSLPILAAGSIVLVSIATYTSA